MYKKKKRIILKKSDKFMKKAAIYSVEAHFLLFFMVFGSSFLPKKEPLLLTDIEIAGEGEFREAMEIARNAEHTNSSLENLGNQQERDIPEMADELKVPEDVMLEPPLQPLPVSVPPQEDVTASETPAAEKNVELVEEHNEDAVAAENEASKIVPIDTPDNEDSTIIKEENSESQKKDTKEAEEKKPGKKDEAAKKKSKEKEQKKEKKKAESKKKKEDLKKKQKDKSKKKDKKSSSKKKRKLDNVIKRVEKEQKQKNRRKKMLDLAEKAEKAAQKKNNVARSGNLDASGEDGNSKGSGRGDSGNGVGAFGVGTALVESDYEIISSQIYPYWVVSSGVKDAENIIIEIHIELGDNGEVIPYSIKIIDEKRYATDQIFRAAVDSARRAILQASPLSIPKEKLEAFKSITLRFNLKEALSE